MNKNMILNADFYKISHVSMYKKGMTKLYSTWTPRSNEYFKESRFVVWFGLQGFLKQVNEDFNTYFFNRDLNEVVEEYKLYIHNTFDETVNADHIVALHKLGYLPIKVSALQEGLKVPYRVPCATIENTHPDFAWLTNYLETLFSCNLWLPATTATTSYTFRQIIEKYIKLTSDSEQWKHVGCGDFSFRGMGSLDSAIASGAAFLTSFTKTSTIPSIKYLCDYYNADVTKEDIGSWSASVEHSCTTSNFAIDGDEETFFKKMITDLYPNKPFSFVADSYDYYNFIDNIVRKNKDLILQHEGCIRIRPDSGDPESVICGEETIVDYTGNKHINNLSDCKRCVAEVLVEELRDSTPHGCCGDSEVETYFKYEGRAYKLIVDIFWNRYDKQYYYIDEYSVLSCEEVELTPQQKGTLEILWDIFGGHYNSKGYRVLDKHIGVVYGDAITLERCEAICRRMQSMGYAVENVVFGVGSYSLQYRTRDSQGWAYKATFSEIEGKPIMIFKDPKTSDNNVKRSQKGMCFVSRNESGGIIFQDGFTTSTIPQEGNLLETVFLNGKLVKEYSLKEIRDTLHRETGGF